MAQPDRNAARRHLAGELIGELVESAPTRRHGHSHLPPHVRASHDGPFLKETRMLSHPGASSRHCPTWTVSLTAAALLALALGGCASTAPRATAQATRAPGGAAPTAEAQARAALQQATSQVVAAERAFASTMQQRNFKAFLTFLSPDAIFFSGSSVERGPAQIAEQWAPYFQAGR